MRRFIISALAVLAVFLLVGGAAVAGSGGGSAVTRARLERALPVAFSHLYVQRAQLVGHHDVTVKSLHAKAMCDKGGAVEADIGPGSNWNCLISWKDPENPMPPEGYGKFELNVHSNGCYTAGGPSKLVGYPTLTDTHGRVVVNPVSEFDGCFDPNGDNAPTGHEFPSLLQSTTTALLPDSHHRVGLQLSCGTGSGGCRGKVAATAGHTRLGTVPFTIPEEQTDNLQFDTPVPHGAGDVTFTITTTRGVGPTSPLDLSMPGH
jgi:hypothetical protein